MCVTVQEHDMDQVNITLDRRQQQVQAQSDEYHTLKKSFAQMEAQLARHTDEKRALQGRLTQYQGELQQKQQAVSVSQMLAEDKGRQVC
jgi:septal ring factor EnvC (AmiA/AmiB activator)